LPDLVLDYHRLKVPVDHPDRSVTRSKLEYPTRDVSFAYLDSISKAYGMPAPDWDLIGCRTSDAFTDIAIEGVISDRGMLICLRGDATWSNRYTVAVDTTRATRDCWLHKHVNRTATDLFSEAVDLPTNSTHLAKLSASGSTLKLFRADLTTPKGTVTDTALASGYVLIGAGWGRLVASSHAYFLRAPSTPSNPPLAIVEADTAGSGAVGDPYAPALRTDLIKADSSSGLPAFLRKEAEKYRILRQKGFTDDEIEAVLGYIPQHQVDLSSVTWGAFELSGESPTNVVMVYGDNPFKPGAVERQTAFARLKGLRALRPPRDYSEAVEQYSALKRDFPHWLAGKDNYAYQALGWEELEPFAVADFYYGELVEHKTHYDQLKLVPDWELERTLEMWLSRLKSVTVLAEERRKHVEKLEKVMKIGW